MNKFVWQIIKTIDNYVYFILHYILILTHYNIIIEKCTFSFTFEGILHALNFSVHGRIFVDNNVEYIVSSRSNSRVLSPLRCRGNDSRSFWNAIPIKSSRTFYASFPSPMFPRVSKRSASSLKSPRKTLITWTSKISWNSRTKH